MKYLLVDLEGPIVYGKIKSYKPWLRSYGCDPIKVSEIFNSLVIDLHKGKISCSRAVKIINKKLKVRIPSKEFYKQRTNYPCVNYETLKFVKKMKKRGAKVYLLSDISKDSWYFIRKKYSFLDIFNQRILSFNTGFRKDEYEYYDYLEKRLNCEKKDLVLIDDKLENIKTARRKGLRAIHFTERTDLNKILKEVC